MIRDSEQGYGLVSRWLHWLMALAILFVFGLGYWMVGLEYYSPYYRSAPDLHRSIGILIGAALIFRFLWRILGTRPRDGDLAAWERVAARAAHLGFYVLILVVVVSGYLISTTDGRDIVIFGTLSIPSAVTDKALTDTMGYIHKIVAYGIIGLTVVHAAAALKHHFGGSDVLKKMVWGPPRS